MGRSAGETLQQVTAITGMNTASCPISIPYLEGHNTSLLVLGFTVAQGFLSDAKYLVKPGEMLPRGVSRSWEDNDSLPAFLLEPQHPKSPQKSLGGV